MAKITIYQSTGMVLWYKLKLIRKRRKIKKLKEMYQTPKFAKTSIEKRDVYEGESIEMKVQRILNNKEGITDGAPLIYQEREEGVQPAFDIRTDKWDIAAEAMSKVSDAKMAKRKEALEKLKGTDKQKKDDSPAGEKGEQVTSGQSTQGTSEGDS